MPSPVRPSGPESSENVAEQLVAVIGESRWLAVALAHGLLAYQEGIPLDAAARLSYERGVPTLKKGREMLAAASRDGLVSVLTPRKKTGKAENPITKMFPATITEERFIQSLENLHDARPSINYTDVRSSGYTLADFELEEEGLSLPLNVKVASTRFEQAKKLVGLHPDDVVPIPAYKANAAVEAKPNLLYVVGVDFTLPANVNECLSHVLSAEEKVVWEILGRYEGVGLRSAEDAFVFKMTRKYWDRLRSCSDDGPFFVISARKAIRILQTQPHRTPGIGLRAWGTGANAEVNVHVSISDDMTAWPEVSERLVTRGLANVVEAVNRRRVEEVYDPEI